MICIPFLVRSEMPRVYRDRDGRKDVGGSGGQPGARDAEPADDMSTSLLDMDTSKLYAQVSFCCALSYGC